MTAQVQRFRRTGEVEAVQWDGTSTALAVVAEWGGMPQTTQGDLIVYARKPPGPVRVAWGDWVIRERADVSKCPAADFAALYEPADQRMRLVDVEALHETLCRRAARIREDARKPDIPGYRRSLYAGQADGVDIAIRMLEKL